MNRELVDKIAQAVLYEGYVLYPYRPSIKSRQRWTFGGVYPKSWSDLQYAGDPCTMRTECLVAGSLPSTLRVIIRFLHLIDRTVQDAELRRIGSLNVGDVQYQDWQEATEREVDAGEFKIEDLQSASVRRPISFEAHYAIEPLHTPDGKLVGHLAREQQAIEGEILISAVELAPGLRKVSVEVFNRTPLEDPAEKTRDDALMRSFNSMHVILGVEGAEFVSLTDPPTQWQQYISECRNVGSWPVLVGANNERDTILASPIILYDYPQLAPESPGDLFDATEIDEILTLRILTLTDEEKRAATNVDHRTRDLIVRTEALAREQLMSLHGTIRGLRPVQRESSHE